ncbi:MAG: polyphosphate kinase 1 [Gemmatimonadales bacterium]
MSAPPGRELKWDVAALDLLRELAASRLPLRLPSAPVIRTFHRDLYFDTADGALSRRGIICRWRVGADDRRILSVGFPDARVVASETPEADWASAFGGTSEAARRLRGGVDPAALLVLAELEVERLTRESRSRWPWRGKFTFVYDAVSVRRSGITRAFQELKVRRLHGGSPALERISETMRGVPGLRLMLEGKLTRAQRLSAALESEALARSLASGRSVALLALDRGKVALVREGGRLRLPMADGQGEAAGRHLLREVLGSSVGDLALLGTVPGAGPTRLLDVWVARRVRRDQNGAGNVSWLPLEELIASAGSPGVDDAETLAAIAFAVRSGVALEPATASVAWRDRAIEPLPAAVGDETTLLDSDLSLVEFNLRVLALAEDARTPILERLGFLAIVSANLDEFFMVNVGALKQANQEARLTAVVLRLQPLLERQQRCFRDCLGELAEHGIVIRGWGELGVEPHSRLLERFHREIFPLLTPRAITISPGFPVPLLPHLTLCLAVSLSDADAGATHFAYLRIPDRLPRFLPAGDDGSLIPVEEVVRANVAAFYPERAITGVHLFRLTRAAEIDLDEEDAGDLLQAMREAVGGRASNAVVRLEVEQRMPREVRDRIRWELRFERHAEGAGLADGDVYEVDGMLDLRSLRELGGAAVPNGRFVPHTGRDPFANDSDIWHRLRAGDVLVHHPYDDFAASVVRFFSEAADDPSVTSIRITLYRVGDRSPIVDALLRARAAGKEVVLFVELKARFDESRNIAWVQQLEGAGVAVVYGVVGLKNHAKVGLVLRREGDVLRRYVHVGTGNYNAATARLYTDLGLFSADPELGADVHDFFNELTGSSHPPAGSYRRIAVAPTHLLPWLLGQIETEIGHALAGREARIRAKLNGLADREVIAALYRASEAGVEVELVVRGLCTLRPSVPGRSSRIRVISLLGRFLEHARIYHFGNGGDDRYCIGSADWRPRNLRQRVEVVVPVQAADGRARLAEILERELADAEAWELRPDGRYQRIASESTSGLVPK